MKKILTTLILFVNVLFVYNCDNEESQDYSPAILLLLTTSSNSNFLNMPLTVDRSRNNPPNQIEVVLRKNDLDDILDDPDLTNMVMFAYKPSPTGGWRLYEYNADYEDTNENGRIDQYDKGAHFPASTLKTFSSVIALEKAKELNYEIDDPMIILDNRATPGGPSFSGSDYYHPDVSPYEYPSTASPRSYADYNGTDFIPISDRNGGTTVDCLWNDFTYPGSFDGLYETYSASGVLAELLRKTQGVSNNYAASYLIQLAGWENQHTRYHEMGFKYFRLNRHYGGSKASTSQDNCDLGTLDKTIVKIDGQITPFTYGNYALYWTPPYIVNKKDGEQIIVNAVYPTRDFYPVDIYDNSDQNNFASAREYMELLRRIVEFNDLPSDQKFNARSEDMEYLRYVMEKTPQELGINYSSGSPYLDDYCKYFMPATDEFFGRGNYTMYNKCGTAMGAFSDYAYIINNKTKEKFVIWWNTYSSVMNRLNLNYSQDKAERYYRIGSSFLLALLKGTEEGDL